MLRPRDEQIDAECIFMGLLAETGEPLDVPRAVINEHVYICGQTGSGKTSLGFIPLLVQLAGPWLKAKRDANDRLVKREDGRQIFVPEPSSPIVVIDLKGDPALFNTSRTEAAKHGRDFKVFSIEPGRPGHIFDFFQNVQPCPPLYLSELILLALSLLHGEGYGRSHYSRSHRKLTSTTLEKLGDEPVRSWDHLYNLVLAQKSETKDADELLNALHAMRFHKNLNAGDRGPGSPDVIHMRTVLERRQMVYFWLPARTAPMSVREIGKLALYALNEIAKTRADSGSYTQTYVFIDEFHMLAGRNMEQMITQARSAGLTLILASQYPSRLAEEELNLKKLVLQSTRLQQYFTLTDPEDIRDLEHYSGKKSKFLASRSISLTEGPYSTSYSVSEGEHEVEVPRFDADVASAVTDDPVGSLIIIPRGAGIVHPRGKPLWVQACWPMTKKQYNERKDFAQIAWPFEKEVLPEKPKKGKPKTSREAPGLTGRKKANNDAMEDILRELGADDLQPPMNPTGEEEHGKGRLDQEGP